jgi:hypothetical protein
MAGEYTGEVCRRASPKFLEADFARRRRPQGRRRAGARMRRAGRKRAAELLGAPVPTRPPGFCVGCPERPVFTALKHRAQELGGIHISSDIGCHTFSTLQPFNLGNTVLGYGLSLAAASAMGPNFGKRIITVMGDGGFWHQGLSPASPIGHFPQRRRRAGDHAERLHLGHRHAEHFPRPTSPRGKAAAMVHRVHPARPRREMAGARANYQVATSPTPCAAP